MKSLLIASMITVAATLQAAEQKKVEILLWQPDSTGVHIDNKNLKSDPGITVYPAEHPNGIAVIMCPGGGYSHQAIAHEGHDMAQWYNAQGITYIVLKYRLPEGNPETPLADAARAVRLIRSQASRWGIDPQKIGIAGASAGGHLASTLATHYPDSLSRPDFQILFYPVVSMDLAKTHKGSHDKMLGKDASDELVALYSNERQVTSDTPQAFIMLSSNDKAVPPVNSLQYAQALIDHGVPVSLHIYPVGGHGWGFRDSFPYKSQWTSDLDKWLREAVLGK